MPTITPKTSVLKYISPKIKQLQNEKSHLISKLHKLQRTDPTARKEETIRTKKAVTETKTNLKNEFNRSITQYWKAQLKQINYRKSDSFFPKINKIFRPRDPLTIHKIELNELSNTEIIKRSNIKTSSIQTKDDKLIISDPTDKLNVIGAHYELINSPKPYAANTRLKEIIDKNAVKIKDEHMLNRTSSTTYIQFSDENKASNPRTELNQKQIFCNEDSLERIIKKLPNKTSSGLDKIPPIIIKHLTYKLITALTIIISNALNHHYFPTQWKCAKVLPILKKGKDPTLPASYRPISLTPALSKVYETVINIQITRFCEENNIIPNNQFGFRINHSTTHAN